MANYNTRLDSNNPTLYYISVDSKNYCLVVALLYVITNLVSRDNHCQRILKN